MEYDSVLGQQSISGKNVSLILCVWKPCYVKSGHKCSTSISPHNTTQHRVAQLLLMFFLWSLSILAGYSYEYMHM